MLAGEYCRDGASLASWYAHRRYSQVPAEAQSDNKLESRIEAKNRDASVRSKYGERKHRAHQAEPVAGANDPGCPFFEAYG